MAKPWEPPLSLSTIPWHPKVSEPHHSPWMSFHLCNANCPVTAPAASLCSAPEMDRRPCATMVDTATPWRLSPDSWSHLYRNPFDPLPHAFKSPSGFPKPFELNPNPSGWPWSSSMDPSLPISSHSSQLPLLCNHWAAVTLALSPMLATCRNNIRYKKHCTRTIMLQCPSK